MKIAVVGLGLIGGSLLKAARRAGLEVKGVHHGDVDETTGADLIFVCLPPRAIVPWIVSHAAEFSPGAVVVDICGVKRPILREIEKLPRSGWYFVGGHPMAGREVSGFENSLETLFDGASMILTPCDDTPATVLDGVKEACAKLGFAMTVVTTPAYHDEMIAFTSQLCHVIATVYARDPRVKDALGFSAGSYANMTRIATQNADDWSALYAENRDCLVGVLDGFLARFHALRDAIAEGRDADVRRQIVEGTAAKNQEQGMSKKVLKR